MQGLENRITAHLRAANQEGGFLMSLVCTEQGLLVAAAGTGGVDDLAALATLFDDVVTRARRDLSLRAVDELALRDRTFGHLVLRPLFDAGDGRMFLVLHVPPNLPWRRTTHRLCARLVSELSGFAKPVVGEVADAG